MVFLSVVYLFFNSTSLFASQLMRASLLEQIYNAEDHRRSNAPIFADLRIFHHKSDLIAALNALGRIGDPASAGKVAAFLNNSDKDVRSNAAQALGLLGGSKATRDLSSALDRESLVEVAGVLALALGHTGSEAELEKISTKLAVLKKDPHALANGVEGLGHLLNKDSAKWNVPANLLHDLAEWTIREDVVAVASAFALTRYKGDIKNIPFRELTESFHHKKIQSAPKALVARVLGKFKSPEALTAILEGQSQNDSIGVRVETARALANFPDEARAVAALGSLLNDANIGVAIQALQSIQSLKAKAYSLESQVNQLVKTGSIAMRAQAIQTLAALNPGAARAEASTFINSANADLASAAVTTLGHLGAESDVNQIVNMFNHKNIKIAGAAIAAMGSVTKNKLPSSIEVLFKQVLIRRDPGLTAVIADVSTSLNLKDLASDLANEYPHYKPDEIETKLAILSALEKIGSKDQIKIVELALKDDERLVALAASSAYKSITGIDVNANIPPTSIVRSKLPARAEIQRASRAVILMHTTRGDIGIQMIDAAPLVAYNFVKLVRQGFYTNKSFHRIVPNFVAQGGDPRGDGYGGPGYLIRDQVSSIRHTRGTIGMATAGKDTAGSQFFINLAPNLHLDGAYTVFGYVLYGINNADKLEPGDVIIDAEVL